MRVFFLSSEVVPYAKTGGLADVAHSLPKTLAKSGVDVKVFTPLYKTTKENFSDSIKLTEKVSSGRLTGSGGGFSVFENNADEGYPVCFIDKKKYYDREGVYGKNGRDYFDNALRFSFFSRAIIDYIERTGDKPDIIHCNDWHTALVPLYLDKALGIKTLFTIHNLAYQGLAAFFFMPLMGIGFRLFNSEKSEFYGRFSFMKTGIYAADEVSTVSLKYAKEIMTPEFGCGLDGFIKSTGREIKGIKNGVDYSVWSPEKDPHIAKKYSSKNIENKNECKKDLLKDVGLEPNGTKAVFGYVGRLAHQKGIDLIVDNIERIVAQEGYVVILGSGEEQYESELLLLEKKYKKNVRIGRGFNNALAHKIEAGSDFFMMPSNYEPCGLNQMYSLKYGTLPIARATGGLDDVVIDFEKNKETGNGIKFRDSEAEAFGEAIDRAFELYENKTKLKKIMARGMKEDHSWKASAKEYIDLYSDMMNKNYHS